MVATLHLSHDNRALNGCPTSLITSDELTTYLA